MLILTRKPGESLYIGDVIKITIVEIKGNQIRVGIDAPTSLRIYREEIYLQILEENRKAAEAAQVPESGLESLTEGWKGLGVKSGQEGSPVVAPLSRFGSRTPKEPDVLIKRKKKKSDE